MKGNESDSNTLGGTSPLDGSRAITEPTSEVGAGETERPIGTDRGQSSEGNTLEGSGSVQRSGRDGIQGANDRNDGTIQPGNGTKPSTDNRAGNGRDSKYTPFTDKEVNNSRKLNNLFI